MDLPNKIYNCRKRLGHSQERLAEEIGVSRQAISKWETGEATPEVTKVLALCKIFSVSADWLLNDDAEMSDLEIIEAATENTETTCNTSESNADEEDQARTEESIDISETAEPVTPSDEIASDDAPVNAPCDTSKEAPPTDTTPTGGFKNLISFKIYKYFGRLGFVVLGFAMYALMAYGVYFYNKCWNNYYGVKSIILACYGLGLIAIGLAGIIASAVMLIASFVHSRRLSTKERVEIVDSRHARFKKYYRLVENKLGFIGAGVILFAASLIMSVGVMFAYNYVLSRSLVVVIGLILMGLATLMVLYSAILFYRVYHSKAVKKQDK